MDGRVSLCLLLMALAGLCEKLNAQQVDFQFQAYKLDAEMADFLQTRLMAGGDSAIQALAKVPNLLKQQKVALQAELLFQAQSGKRVNEASSQRMLEVNKRYREVNESWEVVDGLELEMDAKLDSTGRFIDIDMFIKLSNRSKEGVKVRALTSSLTAVIGVPFLLSRWQEGEEALMIVATATTSSQANAEALSRQMVYLDVAFFQSAVAAKAKVRPDQVGRIVFPTRKGTHAKSEVYVVLLYDTASAMGSQNLGFKVESDVKIDQKGTVNAALILEHAQKTGRRDRLPDGARVPEIEIRRAKPSVSLQKGEIEIVDVEISSLGNALAEPDLWKVTVIGDVFEIR